MRIPNLVWIRPAVWAVGRERQTNKQTNRRQGQNKGLQTLDLRCATVFAQIQQARWRLGSPRAATVLATMRSGWPEAAELHSVGVDTVVLSMSARDQVQRMSALRSKTVSEFKGCQREMLRRYRKILKALTIPNFVTYTTVLLVWMYGGCTQSSSGLEKSPSLKYVKNHKFRPGYHSNE